MLTDARAQAAGCYYDDEQALRARQFIETFCYLEPGKPFLLRDWQYDQIIAPLFGWRRADGRRRFRRAWIELPKKNGKSALSSAIALYMLVADGEYKPEVVCAAWSRQQARIVFDAAALMVKNSPELASSLELVPSTARVVFRHNAGVLRALSKDSRAQEGINASCVIVDEIHAHQSRQLYDALQYAGAARSQPLLVVITTAGDDLSHFAFDLHRQMEKVAAGEGGEESWDQFVYILGLRDGEDWKSIETWRRVNPMLGVTIDEGTFKAEAAAAAQFPSQELQFKRYRLNAWTGAMETPWLPLDAWRRCQPLASLATFRGRSCHAGLDLSATSDLTALVLLFAEGDGTYSVLPYLWCPGESAAARERRGEAPYATWAKKGLIELTEGDTIDYPFIRRRIGELASLYGIKELAIDRLFQGQQLMLELAGDGHNVTAYGQGFMSMAAPARELEILVRGGKLRHGAHEVLSWCVNNAIAEVDAAGNVKPSKRRSREKIDPLVALLMALGCALRGGESGSVYERRGLVMV